MAAKQADGGGRVQAQSKTEIDRPRATAAQILGHSLSQEHPPVRMTRRYGVAVAEVLGQRGFQTAS